MEDNHSEVSGIDRSQFYDLFKEMQNQIKDKVITKYLLLIEHQAKELTELKKENTLLKNQLTYILKRILLNKNDFTSVVRTNKLNNLNSSINYNRSMILKDNNRKSNSMLRPLRSCENYRCVTENITSRYKEGNNSTVNIHGTDSGNNNVDNKVSGYLNSLYRHNFNNSNKTGGNFFLNKNQTLLDELFPTKNSFYMNTENEQMVGNEGNNKNKKQKRENNSTERRSSFKKNNNIRNNYGTKNNSTSKRYKSKYLNINNNSTKKRNKDNSCLENNEKNKYNTINNGSRAQKNKPKKPILYAKRSPFLANKF